MTAPTQINGYALNEPQISGDEWVYNCVLSDACRPKKKRTLYVNMVTGAYVCHRCGIAGGLFPNNTPSPDFVIPKAVPASDKLDPSYVLSLSQALYMPIGKAGLDYLYSRGLTNTVIKSEKLGFDPNKNAIAIPNIDTNGSILSLKYRHLEGDQRYSQESLGGVKQMPYRIAFANPSTSKTLIITEGEFDCLSILSIDPTATVIGLPGKDSFPKNKDESGLLELFRQFKTIYLIPDNEVGSQLAFRRFQAILGRSRAYLPVISSTFKDVNEWLVGAKPDKAALHRLLAQAQSSYDIAYTGLRQLEKQSQEEFKKDSVDGLSTGWEGLDKAISGIRPGELTLLAGAGGSGKSTVATQLLHTIVQAGNYGLVGSFEMSVTKAVIPRLKGLAVGKNLFHETDKTFTDTPHLKKVVFILPNTVEPTIAAFTQAVSEAYAKGSLSTQKIVFALVDNLTRFKFPSTKTTQDKQALVEEGVQALKNLTREFPNLHIMLLCHTTKTPYGGALNKDSVRGSGIIVAEADNVLLVEPTEAGVNLRIEKVRHLAGARSDVISLAYDQGSAILTEEGEY